MSDYWTCATHDWSWENDEQCALCEAVKAEQARIIKLLEENDHYSIDWLIALIKGETE